MAECKYLLEVVFLYTLLAVDMFLNAVVEHQTDTDESTRKPKVDFALLLVLCVSSSAPRPALRRRLAGGLVGDETMTSARYHCAVVLSCCGGYLWTGRQKSGRAQSGHDPGE